MIRVIGCASWGAICAMVISGCGGSPFVCPPTGYNDGYRSGQELALSPEDTARFFQEWQEAIDLMVNGGSGAQAQGYLYLQNGFYAVAYYRYWNGEPKTPGDFADYASVLGGDYTGIDLEAESPPGCQAYEQSYAWGFPSGFASGAEGNNNENSNSSGAWPTPGPESEPDDDGGESYDEDVDGPGENDSLGEHPGGDCDDGIPCTVDSIAPASGRCQNRDICGEGTTCDHGLGQCVRVSPVETDCDDGVFCNGPETFDGFDCVAGFSPCAADETCDEASRSCAVAISAVLHVDVDAPPGGDGRSWQRAFRHPLDALSTAAEANGVVEEIWIAQGTYRPTQHADDIRGVLEFGPGMSLYGGFRGTETSRDQRDPAVNKTTLSADYYGDDGPDFANGSDNTQFVVIASGTDMGSVLDGFTLRGARTGRQGEGELLAVYSGSLTVRNCAFEDCDDSGIVVWWGAVTVEDSSFTNAGGDLGAAITGMTLDGSTSVTNCRFSDNNTAIGVFRSSSPMIRNCTFTNNRTAIYACGNSSPTVIGCTFIDNTTDFLVCDDSVILGDGP